MLVSEFEVTHWVSLMFNHVILSWWSSEAVQRVCSGYNIRSGFQSLPWSFAVGSCAFVKICLWYIWEPSGLWRANYKIWTGKVIELWFIIKGHATSLNKQLIHHSKHKLAYFIPSIFADVSSCLVYIYIKCKKRLPV